MLMQGLVQRCDGPSENVQSTALGRAQYDRMMRDIVCCIHRLNPTHSDELDEAGYAIRHKIWSYGNEELEHSEVPLISIMLEERARRRHRPGLALSTEHVLESKVLTMAVNNDAHTDVFNDECERESSYGLLGSRYLWHDVGRWRGYSPEAARIAEVVLKVLAAPGEAAHLSGHLNAA